MSAGQEAPENVAGLGMEALGPSSVQAISAALKSAGQNCATPLVHCSVCTSSSSDLDVNYCYVKSDDIH